MQGGCASPLICRGNTRQPRRPRLRPDAQTALPKRQNDHAARHQHAKRRRSRTFNWRDLAWIQSFAKTPILLKGILNPSDANDAANSGIAGIIVSNHGGRGLDTVPATIDALPAVIDKIAGRIPVLVDGGIRRGTRCSRVWRSARRLF